MCTSLRGVAFFGASVHVTVGFILFSRYVIATVVFTFYNFNNLFSEKVTSFLAPFMVYVTLLLALGILIFHSVEKECFVILKWSSVAFSLLQLLVFVAILVLKLTPNFQYQQFPFLPDSLVSVSNLHSSNSPTGPEVYLAVPHGTTLDEKDLIIKPSSKSPSSDPPDPGGTPPGGNNIEVTFMSNNNITGSSSRDKDGPLITEIYRLAILVCCVLLTLVYLVFLFLYIRQLNDEDTGHVFGHGGQAVTRNIAFYVQPQFTSSNPSQQPQGIHDNNKGQPGSVQSRSQTQIPQQFLPQPTQQQQHHQQQPTQSQQQSPKKMNQVQPPSPHPSQQQSHSAPHSHPPSSAEGTMTGSPKRHGTGRSGSQQSSLQSQTPQIQNLQAPQVNFSPKRNPHHHPSQMSQFQNQNQQQQQQPPPLANPGISDANLLNPASAQHPPQQQHHRHQQQQQPHQQFQPQQPHPPHLPILGPTPTGGGGGGGQQGQMVNFPQQSQHHPHPQQQQQQLQQPPPPIMRGPIPAQVRIGFFPHDLRQDPQSQNLGVSPQNIRPRPGPYPGETEMVMGGPQQQQPPSQTLLRGPPPPPGQQYQQQHQQLQHHHPSPLPIVGHHPQMQRVQFQQQHSAYPSDSSSSVAYSPNPPRGKHPISMV